MNSKRINDTYSNSMITSTTQSPSILSSIFTHPVFLIIFFIVVTLAVLVLIGNVIRQIREMRRRRMASLEIQIWEAVLNEATLMIKNNAENETSSQRIQKFIIVPRHCTCEPRP